MVRAFLLDQAQQSNPHQDSQTDQDIDHNRANIHRAIGRRTTTTPAAFPEHSMAAQTGQIQIGKKIGIYRQMSEQQRSPRSSQEAISQLTRHLRQSR